MVMGVVYWTLMIGFLVGALGKFFFRRMKQGEIFATMTAGLIGSVLGGWLGGRLGFYKLGQGPDSLIASLIGAVLAVLIYGFYYRKKSTKV